MDLLTHSALEQCRQKQSAQAAAGGRSPITPNFGSERTARARFSHMKRNSLSRWMICLLLAGAGAPLQAAPENQAPAEEPAAGTTKGSLSAMPTGKRAPWQQHFTLGAGDTLNLLLLNPDIPETARLEVPVGPDGRITYLQARDIMAAGLTIDELRGKLDEALAKFYQNPRTVVTPAAYHSKKYILLGAVATRGVFPFDRPVTIIEALARAGGLETGLYEQRTVELADLPHSFLSRKGQRVPVDFERLFQHGDLSQNVALEPDDYLFFASASVNEIYVLGEVISPGVVAFAPKASAISAIANRGGFTTRAFKSRVLVVRGSLNKPETFVVDTSAILKGKQQDFTLQPRDIVYVSQNPWVIGGEVLDLAARAFVGAFTIEATTLNVSPIFKNHLLNPPNP
jgi:protein involved in polysaccharide export with SLBB domain